MSDAAEQGSSAKSHPAPQDAMAAHGAQCVVVECLPKDSATEFLTAARSYVHVLFVDDDAALIAPEPDDPEGRAEARACAALARSERQPAMLQELAEIGMQMARAVRDEALARAEAADEDAAPPARPSRFGGGDLGLVYSRIARAVRQTLALETRVADEIEKVRAQEARAAAAALRTVMNWRQSEIRGYVAQAIKAEAVEREAPERIERLLGELDERLEDGDYDDALADDAPIGELVARICADLGVTPDWSLWEDQNWAIEYELSLPPDNGIGAERWRRFAHPGGAAPDLPRPPPPDSS